MTTKTLDATIRITPPRVVAGFPKRRELLEAIEESSNQITYLVAPPGFGKTVLAAQWIEEGLNQGASGVWIDIDPFESELQFLHTAVAAFRVGIKGFASWFDPTSISSAEGALEEVDLMVEELSRHRKEIRLVLDSADSIGVSSNAIASRFVARLPKNVSIMVLRENSPIATSLGHIGLQDFTVIGPDQLRFGESEVIEMMKGSSEECHAEKILDLTKGWPAATRLVLENVKKIDFEQDLHQSTISPLASITRQALARLSEREIGILRSLVFLDQISNQVAMVITEDELAPMVLAKLAADSFFVTRVISTPVIYEMNRLIRDVLRDDLAVDLERYTELHSKTFDALFKYGPKDQAFNFLAKTGNPERIKSMIADSEVIKDVTTQIRDAIYQDDLASLRSWSGLVPFIEDPSRSLSFALYFYTHLLGGEIEQAKAMVTERSLATVQNKDDEKVRISSQRLQAIVDCIRGDLTASIQCTLAAITRLRESDEASRLSGSSSSSSFLRFGMAAALMQEDYAAMKAIEEFAEQELIPDSYSHFHMNVLSIKAMRAYYEGRYPLAESFASAAISYSKQHKIHGFFVPFDSYFVLFQILMEHCQKDEAEKLYQQVIVEAKRVNFLPWIVQLQSRYAIMLMRDSRFQEGSEEFQSLADWLPVTVPRDVSNQFDRHEMIVQHFLHSDVRKEEIRKRLPKSQTATLYGAQSVLRKNPRKFEEALSQFDMSLPREALNAHVFQVIQNFEYPPKAREHLKKALEVAQENGFYQYLLIQGDRFLSFLISASTEIPSLFLERLSKDASERLRKKLTASDSLPVPLTKREADILRHLASELPLSKISADLNITKNTMKTHLRHLYRKLGASDRRDAVEKGKALLNL